MGPATQWGIVRELNVVCKGHTVSTPMQTQNDCINVDVCSSWCDAHACGSFIKLPHELFVGQINVLMALNCLEDTEQTNNVILLKGSEKVEFRFGLMAVHMSKFIVMSLSLSGSRPVSVQIHNNWAH